MLFRLVQFSQVTQNLTEGIQAHGHVRIIWTVHPLVDGERTFQMSLRGLRISQLTEDRAEVVQANGHIGMVRAKGRFVDRQRPFEIRTGTSQISEIPKRHAQIVHADRRRGVVLSKETDAFITGCAVEAVDSTAAGDAFNGGFASALAAGQSVAEAVRQATLVGALSVTRLGAQPSLPTADELSEFTKTVESS